MYSALFGDTINCCDHYCVNDMNECMGRCYNDTDRGKPKC